MRKQVSLRALVLFTSAFIMAVAVMAQSPGPAISGNRFEAAFQNPEAEKNSRKPARRPTPPGRVTVVPSQVKVAPQVVTVIHRLSGVKVLRFLLRQAGENGVLETIDPETVNKDAHASIIAGWALDDGKTIAARLPQAAAELEVTNFEGAFGEQKSGAFATTPFSFLRSSVDPNLTVVTRDGKQLKARLIGLDAETGLSVMQVLGAFAPVPAQTPIKWPTEGATVQIFAPEPIKPEGEGPSFHTFVRVGKVDAEVSKIKREPEGTLDKLIVQGTQLSPDVIGGVACDSSGNTLGIVESLAGGNASIVSADTIRAATRRVLERQASVPRPVLGVRGELVQAAQRKEFLTYGWRDDQLDELFKAQTGILLTGVMPRTPAALARLQVGDVILRVNEDWVKSTEQFSRLLGQAGSGEQVQFTIQRPDASSLLSIPVTLGGSFSPLLEWRFEMPRIQPFGLQMFGIESMELTAKVASELGAEGGLIVLAVQPESSAAQAGVREGDVIESIDGKIAHRYVWTTTAPSTPRTRKHTLAIVRDHEKKKVVVEVDD